MTGFLSHGLMDIDTVTRIANSKHHLPAHVMLEDAQAMLWSTPCQTCSKYCFR